VYSCVSDAASWCIMDGQRKLQVCEW